MGLVLGVSGLQAATFHGAGVMESSLPNSDFTVEFCCQVAHTVTERKPGPRARAHARTRRNLELHAVRVYRTVFYSGTNTQTGYSPTHTTTGLRTTILRHTEALRAYRVVVIEPR